MMGKGRFSEQLELSWSRVMLWPVSGGGILCCTCAFKYLGPGDPTVIHCSYFTGSEEVRLDGNCDFSRPVKAV